MLNQFKKLPILWKTFIAICLFSCLGIGYYYTFTTPDPINSKEEEQKMKEKTVLDNLVWDPMKNAGHSLQTPTPVPAPLIPITIKEKTMALFSTKTIKMIFRQNFIGTIITTAIASFIIYYTLPNPAYWATALIRFIFHILCKITPGVRIVLEQFIQIGAINPLYQFFDNTNLYSNNQW